MKTSNTMGDGTDSRSKRTSTQGIDKSRGVTVADLDDNRSFSLNASSNNPLRLELFPNKPFRFKYENEIFELTSSQLEQTNFFLKLNADGYLTKYYSPDDDTYILPCNPVHFAVTASYLRDGQYPTIQRYNDEKSKIDWSDVRHIAERLGITELVAHIDDHRSKWQGVACYTIARIGSRLHKE